MQEIEDAFQQQDPQPIAGPSSKWKFWGLFKELWWKGNRNRMFIGIGLMIGQNMTGINGVKFYTRTIFRSIGFDGTRVLCLLLLSPLPFHTMSHRDPQACS